jgi:hypothetical protein
MRSLIHVLAFLCVTLQLSAQNSSPSQGTLAVKGDSVIFLTLTQAELDSLKPDQYGPASEVLSDFYADANRAIAIFREHGLSPIYSDAKKVTFQSNGGKKETLAFDTSQHIVAMALFRPGKKPEITYGILSQDVMLRKASEYFGIAFR